MTSPSLVDIVGIGPLQGLQTVQANTNLGTTPVKITLPDFTVVSGGRARFVKVKVTNPNATDVIAWGLVDRGAAAPSIVATFGSDAGVHVLPGASEIFAIPTDKDLYVVAAGASKSYAVAAFLV